MESETAQYIFPDKTLFFGWTWANVVREAPNRMILNTNNEPVEASFSHEDINSPEALAWIISEVNGLNGQQANDLTGTTVTQIANIDLQQYVWVPIGANLTEAMPFSGKYEGRGHLITNLDIDYIGYSDGRYGYTDYGLFGYVKNDGDNEGVINRTFVVSGLIRPEGTANIGGLVGRMEGANALISNSEAAIEIHCPNLASPSTSQVGSGGLVGKMIGGAIHSSMAMPDVTIDQYYAAGGLVGYADEDAVVENSFANAKFEIGNNGSNTTHGAGGLVGDGKRLSLKNCYSHLYDNATNLPKFKLFVANRGAAEITNCYGFESNYEYCNSGNDNLTSCAKYTSTTDADTYKYMYSDNVVTINGKESPLFQKLNEWVGNSTTYAHWARPTLAEINHDLPVLMLCNYENGDKNKEGLGEFRSLGTYNKGVPLQYGGTVRDGSGKQLSTMLGRDEYVFVYGDVTEDLSSATVEADKVAIYEHAAILNPGKLGEYPNNYVGVTFDNTSRKATDFYGNPLPHDWHLFSTPLSNAPLGIDYNGLNTSTSTQYNHWASPPQVLPVFNFYDATENDGINDGYFPSKVPTGYQNPYANHALNGELDRYKYPFDFFCWYEPDWQWINFKRNGPSHYHYDVDTIYSYHIHDHINYKAYFGENSEDDAPVNVNENTLVKGKGYQMAIHDDTYLQSHGSLNGGEVSITVVNSKESGTLWGVGSLYTGNNLIGNPYHAYLDFDLTGWQGYYLYDADTAGIRNVDYLIYVRGGSKGGCYAPRYLHPHQGFYIQTNTRETLDFLPSMTVTRSVASNTAFRDEKPAYPLVNLFAYDEEGRGDVLVVEFHRPENGGGKKAKALRNGNHLVFAHHDGSDYGAFFAKEGTKQVPVRFQSFEAESKPYTFRWNLQNGDFQSLYLIDNLTGVTYDMLSNDSYSFVASKQDYLSRFLIVFDVTEVEEHEDESLNFAFHDGGSWVVNGKGRLELIDVTGRILYAENLHGDQNRVSLNNYAKGVYLLRLWEGDKPKIQKIIMH